MAHFNDTKELKTNANKVLDDKVARTTSDAEDMIIAIADELSNEYHRDSLESVDIDDEDCNFATWTIRPKLTPPQGRHATIVTVIARPVASGCVKWSVDAAGVAGGCERNRTTYGQIRDALMALSTRYCGDCDFVDDELYIPVSDDEGNSPLLQS